MTAKRWSLILTATVLILALGLAGCLVVPPPTPTEQPKHQVPNGSSEA